MYVLKNGFQQLWKTIVDKEKINVIFNVKIHLVVRNYTLGSSAIRLYKSHGKKDPKWEDFDFLIWSPEMEQSINLWNNSTPLEKKLFSNTKSTFFTSSIVNYFDRIRGLTPIDYWIDKMNNKVEHSVWAQRDTYSVLNGYTGPLYRNKTFPLGDDLKPTKTVITYQMADDPPNSEDLKKSLCKQFKTIGHQINIMAAITWRYFPRYSLEQIQQGVLWDILDMQGQYGMWYIGSSVSFESIKSVVQYNKFLLKNLELRDV